MTPVEYTTLVKEARDRGWSLSPSQIATLTAGAVDALIDRFPKSSRDDIAPIAEILRDNACALLAGNGGKFPPRLPGEKGSWWTREIDRLLDSNNELFAAVLSQN